jgi:hypothetical protein
MAFVYRCPNTGFQFQGYTPKKVAEDSKAYDGTVIDCAVQRPGVAPGRFNWREDLGPRRGKARKWDLDAPNRQRRRNS